MGLDMYLYKKEYVQNWDHTPKEERHEVSVKRGGKKLNLGKVCYIESEVAYWRKANHIHGWFIRECANGIDDCRPVYVSGRRIKELKKLIETLLVSKDRDYAENILPPKEGFFFGSYVIDEYYWQDLENTLAMFNEMDVSNDDFFVYQASW